MVRLSYIEQVKYEAETHDCMDIKYRLVFAMRAAPKPKEIPKRYRLRLKSIITILVLLLGLLCAAFFGMAVQLTTKQKYSLLNSRNRFNNLNTHDKQNSDEVDELLPSWIQEYFQWHKQQRALLQEENKKALSSTRFLLMECWNWNSVCGGTADRLRSVPFMLLVAHRTQRLLLIHWERPFPLEEFLLPPQDGLDWRVPSWLIPHLANQSNFHAATHVDKLIQIASLKNETVITTRLQSHDHGAEYYNTHRRIPHKEPMLRDVYQQIWSMIFTPTPHIAALIKDELKSLGLIPGEYAAAHVRALYLEVDRKPDQLRLWAENAVNCASMLRPGGPIYFASDSTYATQMAVTYGKTIAAQQKDLSSEGINMGSVVVARNLGTSPGPLHLDKPFDNSQTILQPSDFYDTFVDLYLLGMSRCLTYNIGGYGKWGLLLGYNSSCGMRHQKGYGFKRDGLAKCHWEAGRGMLQQTTTRKQDFDVDVGMIDLPLLPPPMD